ncbi:DUF4200 domain containing protein [Asbolus verrucosus]|uniref:DUF4200 domain containing protein n=1 Tax=Asbolus verrucosus TaxID=1661398 RepID=A0A482W7L8_ASBVE|nr:DUF4200 domain containing protein [Asbolus verrucosus]
MEKKEIAKSSFKLSFPRIPAYKSTAEYFKSQVVFRDVQLYAMIKVILRRGYEWDMPRCDPQLYLTSSRRIHDKTEEALAARREFYKGERIKLDQQWKELKEKEEELKQSFIKLNSFIETNEEKRERAKERRCENVKLRTDRAKEIEKLRESIAFMEEAKEELDKEIAEHKFYEAKLSDENGLRILGLNNVVGNLNARYRTASSNAMHWESTVWAIKKKAFQKYQEMNEVRRACWNVYMLMCKRKGEPLKIPESDFEKQLNYIKKTLQELQTVKGEATVVLKKTFSSMKGQTSKVS